MWNPKDFKYWIFCGYVAQIETVYRKKYIYIYIYGRIWLQGVFLAMDGYAIEGKALWAKATFIAESLYKSCVVGDGGKRLRDTGAISPSTTLKSVAGRNAFAWASKVKTSSRFYTLAACRLAMQMLLKYPNVKIPIVGSDSLDLWVETQGKVVMHLCKRARKNSGSSQRLARKKSMDWDETLPMEAWGGVPNQ